MAPSRLAVAITLALVLSRTVHLGGDQLNNDRASGSLTPWGDPDIGGTYAVMAHRREPCEDWGINGAADPTVHITQSPGVVVFRVAPVAKHRVIYIQAAGHPSVDISRYTHGSLGRWRDRALVIESRTPASLLLKRPGSPLVAARRTLVERLSLVDANVLSYTASLVEDGHQTENVVAFTLRRCEGSRLHRPESR